METRRTGTIVTKPGEMTPNGRERVAKLIASDGEVIVTCRMWPWSERSCEAAYTAIYEAAYNADIEIIEG